MRKIISCIIIIIIFMNFSFVVCYASDENSDLNVIEASSMEPSIPQSVEENTEGSGSTNDLLRTHSVPLANPSKTWSTLLGDSIFNDPDSGYWDVIQPDGSGSTEPVKYAASFDFTVNQTYEPGEFILKVPKSVFFSSDGTSVDSFSYEVQPEDNFALTTEESNGITYAVLTNIDAFQTKSSAHTFTFIYTPLTAITTDTHTVPLSCALYVNDEKVTETEEKSFGIKKDDSSLNKYIAIQESDSLTKGGEIRDNESYAWDRDTADDIVFSGTETISINGTIPAGKLCVAVPEHLLKINDESADALGFSVSSITGKDDADLRGSFTIGNIQSVAPASGYYGIFNNTDIEPQNITIQFSATYSPNTDRKNEIPEDTPFSFAVSTWTTAEGAMAPIYAGKTTTVTVKKEVEKQHTFDVSTEKEFSDALNTINNAESGQTFYINILDDFESVEHSLTANTLFINGNGHTLTVPKTSASGSNHWLGVNKNCTLQMVNITITGQAAGPAIEVNNGGNLIMNRGASISNYEDTSGSAGGIAVDGGILTLNDGSSVVNCISRYGFGGGVLVTNNGNFVMNGGTISGCQSNDGYGGGVCVMPDSSGAGTFTMNGGLITKCSAYAAGAVLIYGGTGTFSGGEITENNAEGDDGGGGLYADGSNVVVTGCAIYNNTASGMGADVCNADGGSITLPDAKKMEKIYQDTGISIDGWYKDESGARWTAAKNEIGYETLGISTTKDLCLIAAYSQYQLTIQNKVTGNMGSRAKQFKYSIKFDNLSEGYKVAVEEKTADESVTSKLKVAIPKASPQNAGNQKNAEGNPTELTADKNGHCETDFYLYSGESISFLVQKNISYTVQEDKAIPDSDEYIVTASLTGDPKTSGNKDIVLDEENYSIHDNELVESTQIIFTNDREWTVPTGTRIPDTIPPLIAIFATSVGISFAGKAKKNQRP